MKNAPIERTTADTSSLEGLREVLASFLCASVRTSEWPYDVAIHENWVGGQFGVGFFATTNAEPALDWAMGSGARIRPSMSLCMPRAKKTSHSLIDPAWSAWFFIDDPRQRDESTTAEGPVVSEPGPRYRHWIRCRLAAAQDIPSELIAVADWLGVTKHLEKVRQFTEDVFPGPLKIMPAQDPDIPGDWHIVFCVQASGEIRDILKRQDEWHRRLLSCTKPHSNAFRISIDAR